MFGSDVFMGEIVSSIVFCGVKKIGNLVGKDVIYFFWYVVIVIV